MVLTWEGRYKNKTLVKGGLGHNLGRYQNKTLVKVGLGPNLGRYQNKTMVKVGLGPNLGGKVEFPSLWLTCLLFILLLYCSLPGRAPVTRVNFVSFTTTPLLSKSSSSHSGELVFCSYYCYTAIFRVKFPSLGSTRLTRSSYSLSACIISTSLGFGA